MLKHILYIFLLGFLITSCGEDLEKRQRIETNLQLNLDALRQSNQMIYESSFGAIGTFEQAIAGMQASGASKHDIERVSVLRDLVSDVNGKLLALDSQLIIIQNQEVHNSTHLIRNEFYNFRNYLCHQLLTKHPQNKPISVDFSEQHLRLDSDSVQFNNEVGQLLLEVDKIDADAVTEICKLLSFPDKVVFGESLVSWNSANFENDLLLVNKLNVEAIRTRLLTAGKITFERMAMWVQAPKFDFNKLVIVVNSKNPIVKNGKELVLNFMVVAFDSTEVAKIRYWIDDPKMQGEPYLFEGNDDCMIDLSNQSAGKHTIFGVMSQKHGELERWLPWTYEYYIVE